MTRRKRIENIPEGYLAWSVITALQRHINTTYDMVKYRGKMKSINHSVYERESERNKIIYSIIEKNCERREDEILRMAMFMMVEYSKRDIIMNPHHKAFIMPAAYTHNLFLEMYDNYKTKIYNRRETFTEDLKLIVPMLVNEQSGKAARKAMIKLLTGDAKEATLHIYKTMIQQEEDFKPMFESLVVLDQIGKGSDKIIADSEYKDSIYGDMARRINKVSRLYNPDLRKYEKFILDYCKQTETGESI
jgi:hypothetical protein